MPQLLRFPYIIARFSIVIFLAQAFNSSFLHAGVLTSVPAHQQSSSERDAEIARLSVQLRTADPEGRREAAISLSHFKNNAATSALIAALADSSLLVRAAAATSLGDIGDSSAVGALASRLASDKEDFVRKAAAYALGQLSGSESTKALVAALKDREPEVRGAAAVSLGEHADATTVPPLSS